MTETNTVTLTRESVAASLSKAVAERGEDYVYTPPVEDADCQYLTYELVEDAEWGDTQNFDCPNGVGCLVGYVLVDHGVPMDQIARQEGQNASGILDALSLKEYVSITDAAIADALLNVQSSQDSGVAWGQAVPRFAECLAATDAVESEDAE